jgi:hypothetical protein
MLLLDYDPADVWGTLVLDLSLPWDHIIAASLYGKVRQREKLREKLLTVYTSQGHHSAHHARHAARDEIEYYSLIRKPTFVRAEWLKVEAKPPEQTSRPVDELPDWEAKCWLDDHAV